MYVCMYISI